MAMMFNTRQAPNMRLKTPSFEDVHLCKKFLFFLPVDTFFWRVRSNRDVAITNNNLYRLATHNDMAEFESVH
jgi:hypothetical protein